MPEKILIVDDDEEFADLLGLLMKRRGYDAVVTYGGVQAFEAAQRLSPAIILQDYMLPDYRGMDLLKDLRAKCPDSYVIIITARGSEEVAVELMKSGASDYLKKPFDAEKLITTVENMIRLRAAELEQGKLNRELAQQNQELMAFNAFAMVLTSGMADEEKCRSALGIVVKNMKADVADLFVSVNGRGLKLHSSAGRDSGGLKARVYEKGTGLASYVAEIKKPAVVSDFKKEKRFKVPGEAPEQGMTSALGVPMLIKDSVKGALVVYTKDARAFPSFDIKMMGIFANQLALAIDNAGLSGRLDALQRRWQGTFDAVPDRVTVQDINHTIVMANKAAAETAGLDVKDLVGQKSCWVFHNVKEPIHDCPVTEAMSTKKPVYRELALGAGQKFQIWAYPLFDADGNAEFFVEYARTV